VGEVDGQWVVSDCFWLARFESLATVSGRMVGHSERDAGTAIYATAIGAVDGAITERDAATVASAYRNCSQPARPT
jgi:hypothetical protein